MQLHEYQAKNILKKWGIPTPPFFVVSSLQEAEELKFNEAVLKVQVHAGGRGKAGGVQFAKSPQEIVDKAKALIGMKIVNEQTGPRGAISHYILVTAPVEIKKEYYIGIVIDRKKGQVSLIVSPEGGMEIEEVAKKSPEKIHVEPLSKEQPISDAALARIEQFLGWKNPNGRAIIRQLEKLFFAVDGELLELNPFVETASGELTALDAKLTVDDNALFRQEDIAQSYDHTQISELEREARGEELAFIPLDGSIGCMVNGAGLAMATMDLISLKGGRPANFLDVGGSATEDKVIAGFELLLKDPQVKAIFINIFGGIMNCATIATALQKTVEKRGLQIPVVVRMEGTNSALAREIIATIQGPIQTVASFDEAAAKVVACLSS